MKKLLIAAFCFNAIFASAQFTLQKLDGTPINNGDVFIFNELEEPNNYLGFKIYNNTSGAINMKAKVESITNFDTASEQTNALCFDPFCSYNVVAGLSYSSVPLTIPANGSNGNFDYFENMNSGLNPTQPVEYVLKIYQLDGAGGESEFAVTFTYRYVSALAVNSFAALKAAGINVKSTIVSDKIEIFSTQDFRLELFDATGKTVLAQNLNSGQSMIDSSQLTPGIYIASFKNNAGLSSSVKLIRK